MATIEIYTTRSCPYCNMAKSLLDNKQAGYREIRVDGDGDKVAEAVERSGGAKQCPRFLLMIST
ncbi:MAG: glutaredoxin domain-containing protein [Desulfobacterales bacterium]